MSPKFKVRFCVTTSFVVLIALIAYWSLLPDRGFQLRYAVETGDIQCVRELLASDPNLVNTRDTTHLDGAATREVNPTRLIHWKMARSKQKGMGTCGFSLREANGATALYHAATGGRLEIVELLVSSGAELESKNRVGRTPLFAAISGGTPEVVALLLVSGATVNFQDHRGESPLHYAARILPEHNTRESVSVLLRWGADPNAVDPTSGYTPLHWAALCANEQVCRILLQAGADPNITDKWGRSPASMATKIGIRLGLTNLVEAFCSTEPKLK